MDNDSYAGQGSIEACEPPQGYVLDAQPEDCDDNEATTFPDAEELCDGVDQDCDGEIDEGVKNTYFIDADGGLSRR